MIDVASGEDYQAPDGARHEPPELIRYLADDLKAFYLEAAAAQPRSRRPSAPELNSWLFTETVFGSVLYGARDALEALDDPATRLLAFFLVPQVYRERPGVRPPDAKPSPGPGVVTGEGSTLKA